MLNHKCQCRLRIFDKIIHSNLSFNFLQKHFWSDHPFMLRHPGAILEITNYITYYDDTVIFQNLHNNSNITFDFICEHSDKEWDWSELVKHPNITIKDIFDNLDLPLITYSWWENPNIMPDDLMNSPDYKWFVVSSSPNASIEYIIKHKTFPWIWSEVSANPNLTVKIISEHPEIKSDYNKISTNLMEFHPVVYNNKIREYTTNTHFIIQHISNIIIWYIK